MKIYIFIVLTALTLIGCGPQKSEGPHTITVTIEPLRFFVNQIVGNKYKVVTMVPNGSNPETYEPTARQMMDLAESDIYIKVGSIGFECTWMKKLTDNAPHTIIIDSSDGIAPISNINNVEDPHTWMSCANAQIIARNIYDAVMSVDIQDSAYFRTNYERLLTKIKQTDKTIRANLKKSGAKEFIIYHPVLTYFAKEYDLIQLPIEEEGREPSAAQLKQLLKTAKQLNIQTIFIQQEFANRDTDIITKELEIRPLEINPLSYFWDKQMVQISELLK